MISVPALVQLARADFLERIRRHSFLVTLGFAIFAACMFLPPNHATYSTLHFAGHRGLYGSAWVGGVIAMLTSTFLGLAGFYLVRNAIERDRRTGVGQILAATPLPTPLYLLAKMASNFAVLAAMVIVVAGAAAVMQLVRAEDTQLRPLALLAPFVVLTLPVMALVAALAVVFEVTPGLRGGLGNVVYFFLWTAGLMLTAAAGAGGRPDPLGGEALIAQMHAACIAAFPDFPAERGFSMGFNIKSEGAWDLRTFAWSGAVWTPAMLASRASWVAVSTALALLGALWFDRFDACPGMGRGSSGRRKGRVPTSARGNLAKTVSSGGSVALRPVTTAWARPVASSRDPARSVAVPRASAPRLRLGGLAMAEARIMLKGVSRWWGLIALGLAVASLFAPLPVVKAFLAPFSLIWPLLLWSPLGSRERACRTDELLFSTPRPVARLLAAQWLAGAALALAVTGGALARFALIGEWTNVAALLVAAGFVPSLALALGTWSGSARLFEVLYLMLWYMGPMNRIPALDYAGATQPGTGAGTVAGFLAVAVVLAGMALIGRFRQLRR